MSTDYFEMKLAKEVDRLRKGIQDYLDGDYIHPRTFRAQGANTTCPHGRYYYEDCGECIDQHFAKLLAPVTSHHQTKGE
jgi:hypothetical protein